MSLIEKLILPEAAVTDRAYFEVLESHLTYIKSHPSTRHVSIAPDQAAIFKGDLYGLLNSMSIDKKYHYSIMRINGYLASSEYDGKRLSLFIPDENIVSDITTIYLSREEN